MVLPAITYNSSDVSHNYGLRQLFWFGRSNCDIVDGNFYCDRNNWITAEGWQEQLRQFVGASRADEHSELMKDVLWIYVPDHEQAGSMSQIQNITTQRT